MPAMMQYASAAPVATRGSVRARPLDPPRVIAMSFSPIGPRKKLTVLASVSNVYRCHGNPPPLPRSLRDPPPVDL